MSDLARGSSRGFLQTALFGVACTLKVMRTDTHMHIYCIYIYKFIQI